LLLLEIVRCGRSNPIGSLRFAVVVLVVGGGVIRMIIRILISTATFTRRADDGAASILRYLLMRKRERERMKDHQKSVPVPKKERERERKRERENGRARRMTLHETAHERNETRNRTSFFVFFFRCDEEKHETHKDAIISVVERENGVVVVGIISSNDDAFSLSERVSSCLIYSFSFLWGDCSLKTRENTPKRWIIDRSSLCFFARFPPKKRKREKRGKNFKIFLKKPL
jgi:hypothetical protein